MQKALPGLQGFSARNDTRMRAFYQAYRHGAAILPQVASETAEPNLPQAAAKIPWFQNVILIEKVKIVFNAYGTQKNARTRLEPSRPDGASCPRSIR
jgi:hypothetical protein